MQGKHWRSQGPLCIISRWLDRALILTEFLGIQAVFPQLPATEKMTKRDAAPPVSAHLPAHLLQASAPIPVPVVGIGASSGGLEPVSAFLASLPPGIGLAFVVVIVHLDPEQEGVLPELLQRVASMPVRVAVDGMVVDAETVYVIPQNTELGFAHGRLQVSEPRQKRGLRLPIDSFFTALALECGEHATGVLMSGMGMDGTCGLRALQDASGMALVQLPKSAQCDAMPQNAIDAGAADMVDTPQRLAQRVSEWAPGNRPLNLMREPSLARRSALGELLALLQYRTGNDFSEYKMNTVLRRIERRMSLHQVKTLVQYVGLLRENPSEVDLLFKEMLIGVTSLFRDQRVWDEVKTVVLPQLLVSHPGGADFKAWVPACSTGEEAYSLAMLFNEVLMEQRPTVRYTLQIFATDLDPDAIERARRGFFPRSIEEQGYRIRKELRNMIIFAEQNVISDPPFTKLDLLSCRNLLIYFSAKLQQQLIPLFHYVLKPGGTGAGQRGHATPVFRAVCTAGQRQPHLQTVGNQCAARVTLLPEPGRSGVPSHHV